MFKVVEAFLQLDGERRDECEVPGLHSRVNCKAAMSAAELHAILVELEAGGQCGHDSCMRALCTSFDQPRNFQSRQTIIITHN